MLRISYAFLKCVKKINMKMCFVKIQKMICFTVEGEKGDFLFAIQIVN